MHGRHQALQLVFTAHKRLANYSYDFKFDVSVLKVEAEGKIKNRLQNA
jgi:hypothetical protein